MKAMVLESMEKGAHLINVELPEITENDEVILQIKACGVCATDIKVMKGDIETNGVPRILGHEPMGIVVKKGSAVHNVKIGDRVVTATYVTCKSCKYCRTGRETLCEHVSARIGITMDGAFAEYMKIKCQNLVKVPDGVRDEEAAVMPCGAGVPYHALVKRIKLTPMDRVIVLGVGGVGMQALQLAALCGAETAAVDINEDKLGMARDNGAAYTVNSSEEGYLEKLRAWGEWNVLFDTTGYPPAITGCASILVSGSRVVLAGYGKDKSLSIPLADVVLKELEIYGSRGVSIQDIEELMSLVERKKLQPVTHMYPMQKIEQVFEDLQNNRLTGRAVIVP